MKKLFSVIALTLAVNALNAQTSTTTTTVSTTPQKWRVGITANAGGSWLKSNRSEMTYKSPGLQYGLNLQVEKRLTNTVSFLTGVNFSWHSGTVGFVNDTNTVVNLEVDKIQYEMVSRNYHFQSVDIPLGLKLKTNEIGMITYWAQVGVLPSVRVNAYSTDNTYKVGNTESTFSGANAKMTVNDANFFRASIFGGLGIEYSLSGSTALTLGVQYVSGFLSTMHSTSNNMYTNGSINNKLAQNIMSNYVTLNAGILF